MIDTKFCRHLNERGSRNLGPFNIRDLRSSFCTISTSPHNDMTSGMVLLKLYTNGKMTTQFYDKRDDFNFSIVNLTYLCNNIPASPAYGVYILQLIRYARACSTYDQFLVRGNCVRKFVSLLAEGLFPNTLYNVSGFSLPLIKTDRHHITEKLLSMVKILNNQSVVWGSLLINSWCHRSFNCLVYMQLFANFRVVTTILFTHTTFLWATCCSDMFHNL
jgi:hypothetical protein